MTDSASRKKELQGKSDRVHAARLRAEQFIAASGDMTSTEARLIGEELAAAANDLSSDFGFSTMKKHE